eukprot:GHVN01019483.1.p1 GENE.GHVN01019483.1~~GHVN01019483.1.p1  ORF type:complete len:396 (-),score=19.89 GHVN01019483.1:342-1406(-)
MNRVLVHCIEGVSRSATIAVGFLMWLYGMPACKVLEKVRSVRDACNPNTGFIFQLLRYGNRSGVHLIGQEDDTGESEGENDDDDGQYEGFEAKGYNDGRKNNERFGGTQGSRRDGDRSRPGCQQSKPIYGPPYSTPLPLQHLDLLQTDSLSQLIPTLVRIPRPPYSKRLHKSFERKLYRITIHNKCNPWLIPMGCVLWEKLGDTSHWQPHPPKLDPRFWYILRNFEKMGRSLLLKIVHCVCNHLLCVKFYLWTPDGGIRVNCVSQHLAEGTLRTYVTYVEKYEFVKGEIRIVSDQKTRRELFVALAGTSDRGVTEINEQEFIKPIPEHDAECKALEQLDLCSSYSSFSEKSRAD